MNLQKKNLLLRVLLMPFKLVFHLLWQISIAFILTTKWVLYGGDELVYGSEFSRGNIDELIQAVEKLTENK